VICGTECKRTRKRLCQTTNSCGRLLRIRNSTRTNISRSGPRLGVRGASEAEQIGTFRFVGEKKMCLESRTDRIVAVDNRLLQVGSPPSLRRKSSYEASAFSVSVLRLA
jgi:hypothetical protein